MSGPMDSNKKSGSVNETGNAVNHETKDDSTQTTLVQLHPGSGAPGVEGRERQAVLAVGGRAGRYGRVLGFRGTGVPVGGAGVGRPGFAARLPQGDGRVFGSGWAGGLYGPAPRRENGSAPISRRTSAGEPERLPSGRARKCWWSWESHGSLVCIFREIAPNTGRTPSPTGQLRDSCHSRCKAAFQTFPDRCGTCGRSVAVAAAIAGRGGYAPRRAA